MIRIFAHPDDVLHGQIDIRSFGCRGPDIRPTGPTGFPPENGIISGKEDKGAKLSLDLWSSRNFDCRQVLRSENKSPILCKII